MRKLLLLCLFIIPLQGFSQNQVIDNLQQRVSQAKGSKKILELNELAIAYWKVNPTKSISLGNEALKLAEQFKYFKVKARTYNIIGVANYYLKKYTLADSFYDKSLETAKKYGTAGDIYNSLGNKISLYLFENVKPSKNGQDIYKRYINLTLRKKNYLTFYRALVNYISVYHNPITKDSLKLEYIEGLKTKNTNKTFLADKFACEGYLYRLNGNFSQAIEKYEQALKYVKEGVTKVMILVNIGSIYSEMGLHKESISYFNDGMLMLKHQKPALPNNTRYYLEACLGESYLHVNKYKKALEYFLQLLNHGNFVIHDRGVLYNNLGIAYLSLDSLEKAEKYIQKSILLFDSLKEEKMKLAALNTLAKLFIRKNETAKLPKLFNQILDLSDRVNDSYITVESYHLLSGFYERKGNYKKANEYLHKWVRVHDSILNKKTRYALDEFQVKYKTAQKNQQIKLQEATIKNKTLKLQYSLAGAGVVFVALLIIIFLYRKRNQAYRHLVYLNLKTFDKKQNDPGEKENDLQDYHNTIDSTLKQQILTRLDQQMEAKIYLETGVTINYLSEKCKTNRSYLSQIIHEKYQMNFNNFINKYRIEEAKRIFMNPDNNIPLKALYEQLGFSSYSRFHEAFKRHTGVTPSFFLKTIKTL